MKSIKLINDDKFLNLLINNSGGDINGNNS